MEAIILAGGAGTRLRSVVPDLPKPMAPIHDKPFLELLLSHLWRQGVEHFVISVGYMAENIMTHFGSHYKGVDITYAIEDTPLGTGGAIKLALEKVNGSYALVLNGDSFVEFDANVLCSKYHESQHSMLLTCKVDDTQRYGRVQHDGSLLTGFSEKGISGEGIINAGCYVLPKNELGHFLFDTNFSFESDHLPVAISGEKFSVHYTDGLFIDIGVPEDYQRAVSILAGYL